MTLLVISKGDWVVQVPWSCVSSVVVADVGIVTLRWSPSYGLIYVLAPENRYIVRGADLKDEWLHGVIVLGEI